MLRELSKVCFLASCICLPIVLFCYWKCQSDPRPLYKWRKSERQQLSRNGGTTRGFARGFATTGSMELPTLTLEAQDKFYGAGCKEHVYRKRLQRLLAEWMALARRRNITQYFISHGSFLGSVRNGDMIPYDTDIDVCIFREDFKKLAPEESQRPVNLNNGEIHLLLQPYAPRPNKNTPRRNCRGQIVRHVADDCSILDPHGRLYATALIWVDIFLLGDFGDKLWDEYEDKMLDRDAVFPTKPCTFLGLQTECPNNEKKYLETFYGENYMKASKVCRNGKWEENE